MVIDWVIGYATIDHDEGFGVNYATPPASSPHATVGLVNLTEQLILDDITGDNTDHDD